MIREPKPAEPKRIASSFAVRAEDLAANPALDEALRESMQCAFEERA